MKKETKKTVWTWIYILATILVISYIGLTDPNVKSISEAFAQINMNWMSLAIICMLIFWLGETVSQNYLTRFIHGKESFGKSLKIAMIGQYYSALTPFSSGGQPFQIIYMKKNGIPVGTSTFILLIKFLVYHIVLVTISLVIMILRGGYFYQKQSGIFWLTLLGFAVNIFIVLTVGAAVINKKFVLRVGMWLTRVGKKLHIVKDLEKAQNGVEKTINEFQAGMQFVRKNRWKVAACGLMTAVQLIAYYSVSYFIYRAFGFHAEEWITMMALQAFLYMTVAFIPLPGASVAAEGGFYLFFSEIFPSNIIFIAMILWRVITYYSNIIVGAAIVVGDSIQGLFRKSKKNDVSLTEKPQ